MAGLLIYGRSNQFSSFVIFDEYVYKETRREFVKTPYIKLYFDKGNLTLQQIEEARDKTSEIVRNLNLRQEVDIKKELSDYFN